MVNISFPGIGIEQFSVNKVAFEIPLFGGIEVRWYGLIITTGILLAMLYCYFRSKEEGIKLDDLLDMAIYTVIFGILGARLYYVLFTLDEYNNIYEAIAIWEGGLAIYGAIIAGALTILVICKIKKIVLAKALDMAAPAVMIGQILGRWGNFFNGEAHGGEVLESEFFYFIRMGLSHGEGAKIVSYYHPTFLYESLWNLVGFIIINALYKKKKFDGQIVLMYVTWYGFGRMLIEGLRTDSLYLGVFRISQIVGFACFVVGAILLVLGFSKARRATLTAEEYVAAYPKFSHTVATPAAEAEATEESAADDESSNVDDEETDETDETDEEEKEADISDKLKNLFEDDKN